VLSTLALLLRLVVSLAIVFGLMAGCAALLRRSGMGGPSAKRRGLPVEVLARHTRGRRASVAVIRTGGRGLVLGITDHTVTLLAEGDPDDFAPPIPPESSPRTGPTSSPWKALLTTVQDRTARR
jgi:flagellar protein FliO/FliZ